MLIGIALIWGSSFLLIEISLESLQPAVITWLRSTLGFLALTVVPAAREPLERVDHPKVAVIGVLWLVVPLSMFPIAQQHIDSALAGMLNASVPIFGALVASVLLRSLPRVHQAVGIALGFAGAATLSLPEAVGSSAVAWGVSLVLLATFCYGTAMNLAVPLQQRYGAPALMMRALAVASVITAPFGLAGLSGSQWDVVPVVAVVVLGVVNTGAAFAIMAALAGRAGATRAGTAVYCIPIVSMVLGMAFNSEVVLPVQWAGIAIVLFGAWLTSRREHAIIRRIR